MSCLLLSEDDIGAVIQKCTRARSVDCRISDKLILDIKSLRLGRAIPVFDALVHVFPRVVDRRAIELRYEIHSNGNLFKQAAIRLALLAMGKLLERTRYAESGTNIITINIDGWKFVSVDLIPGEIKVTVKSN